MYSLESIKTSINKVIAKEKLSEEQIRTFFALLQTICQEVLNPLVESKEPKVIPNDLDELIKVKLRETKTTDTKISVSWFIQNGFNEVLDSGADYYQMRSELLSHSKILKEDPKSLDFLYLEVELAQEKV